MNQDTLATELLHEVKASAKRWFIIAMVELVAIVVLIILLFVMPSQITEETSYEQDVEDVDTSDVVQRIGDYYGNSETDGDT